MEDISFFSQELQKSLETFNRSIQIYNSFTLSFPAILFATRLAFYKIEYEEFLNE
jgi:hypothetical protein